MDDSVQLSKCSMGRGLDEVSPLAVTIEQDEEAVSEVLLGGAEEGP